MNINSQKLAYWFIAKATEAGSPINPAKLIQLVVLANQEHIRDFGQPLMNERPEAWEHSPMIPTLYHEYKNHGFFSPIEHPSRRQSPPEPDEALEAFLSKIWTTYSKYTARQLTRAAVSPGTPWALSRESQEEGRRPIITQETIQQYYDSIRSGSH